MWLIEVITEACIFVLQELIVKAMVSVGVFIVSTFTLFKKSPAFIINGADFEQRVLLGLLGFSTLCITVVIWILL